MRLCSSCGFGKSGKALVVFFWKARALPANNKYENYNYGRERENDMFEEASVVHGGIIANNKNNNQVGGPEPAGPEPSLLNSAPACISGKIVIFFIYGRRIL